MTDARGPLPPAPADLPDVLEALDEVPPDLRGLEIVGQLLRGLDLSEREATTSR